MLLMIGSRALALRAPELLKRCPADFDFVGTYDDADALVKRHRSKFQTIYPEKAGAKLIARGENLICEFEIAWEGSDTTSAELMQLAKDDPEAKTIGILDQEVLVASKDLLYLLKRSHRFLKDSPHFLKTMGDYRALRGSGAVIRPEHQDFLKRREKETYIHKHPKLNVSKGDFFKGDGVIYTYDHDTIHLSMKHLERPAYTYFKPTDREVMCDRKMFEAADEPTRLFSVLEEAQVLALERSQIPFPGVKTPRQSFNMALMKVCTSITSGWWREYAYENYHVVQSMYEPDYVDRLWTAVHSGLVKLATPFGVQGMGQA